MSPRTVRRIFAVVVALAIGLAAYVIFGVIGFEEFEDDVGYRGAARENPMLAAERTLEGMGREVETANYLGELPPADALLVLRQSGRLLSPVDVERLIAWVEQGGHLVVLLPGRDFEVAIENDLEEERFSHPLLDALQVDVRLDADAEREVQVDLGRGLRRIEFEGQLTFADPNALSDVDTGDAMLARVLGLEHGYGRITLFADDDWALNADFGELDHPYVLDDLASFDGERHDVRFVLGERPPGLLALLWKHGWPVISSAAVLLALTLWRRAFTAGPKLGELTRERRDFSEHVLASGEFLWRARLAERLLAAPRSELRRRIGVVRPELLGHDEQELARALAEQSGLGVARVRAALCASEVDKARFTEIVRDLETVRRSL